MAYERSMYSDMYSPNNMFGVRNTNATNNLNNQTAFLPSDKRHGVLQTLDSQVQNDLFMNEQNKKQYQDLLRQDKEGFDQGKWDLTLPKGRYVDAGNVMNDASNFNIFGMSRANADIPTDAEKAALYNGVNNTTAANRFNNTVAPNRTGVTGAYRPNMRDISGEVGEYGNTSGFDLSNMDMNNPDAAIGPIINFKDAPVEWNETLKGLRMNNPRFGPIDMWKNQGGNETTGVFSNFRDKLGMTQVTDADKLANKQFMQDQGIYRDPQTGRMIGGDFEGMNAPGTSGWGSANFGEMAQNWMDDYGDVEYSTGAIGDMKRKKQARMKKAAIEYAQKLKADKIAADAAKAAPTTGGDWRPSQPGGATLSQLQSPAGNYAAARARTSSRVGPGGNVRAYGLAQGGRVGYNRGGRVGILSIF